MGDALPWDQFNNSHPLCIDTPSPALIIGAGLAGSWLARTLAESGFRVTVLDAGPEEATGASSNPAGIAKPFVTRNPCLAMSFYLQAHSYLLQRLYNWQLAAACNYQEIGVIQLVENAYPASEHYDRIEPQNMRAVAGFSNESHAILFERAGWLNPKKLCRALLDHPFIEQRFEFQVDTICKTSTCWQVSGADTEKLHTSHLAVATGASLKQLALTSHLDIMPARGQISRFDMSGKAQEQTSHQQLRRVISGKHYVIPDANSLIVGASFERNNDDDSIREADNIANRLGLKNTMPEAVVSESATEAFAGVRATTPDRLPLIGPLPDSQACNNVYSDLQHGRKLSRYPALPVHEGVFVLAGLGSRGIVTSAFAASLLADFMIGGHQLLHWGSMVNPARFHIRRLKRAM